MSTVKSGNQVALQHYSGIKLLKGFFTSMKGDTVNVKLDNESSAANFLAGDPVVMGYGKDEKIYIIGSCVNAVNHEMSTIELKTDIIEPGYENREYERIQVSLCADVRCTETRQRYDALIKDISYYGMLIYSKADFNLNQKLEINVYMDKVMLFLDAHVVRKVEWLQGFQYGLGLHYKDNGAINYVKGFINKLAEDRLESIKRFYSTELK